MNTNSLNSLDETLRRAGRIGHCPYMGYCTEDTARQTFKRMFDTDLRRTHSTEAINSWADIFALQFPRESTLVPATLAQYFITKREQPQKAIEDFPQFLQSLKYGEDVFAYDIKDLVTKIRVKSIKSMKSTLVP